MVKTSVVRGQVGNTTLYGEPIPGKIMIRETMTDIRMYVHPRSLKHGRLPPRDTSEELCKCCGISDERMKGLIMHVLLEEDHQEIEDMLSKQRIGGYDANDLEAVPIKVTAQNRVSSSSQVEKAPSNVPARPEGQNSMPTHSKQTPSSEISSSAEPTVLNGVVNQSRPSKTPYQGYSSSASAPEMTARELKQAARHAEIGESIRINGRENIPSQTHASGETSYSAKKTKPNTMLRPTIRPARKSSPHKSTHERTAVMMTGRDQFREETIGIRGEEAVFYILKVIFGDAIDESAWTSELRHHVQGFKLWVPEDPTMLYSDFTIRDKNGYLMKWMIANNVTFPADWEAEADAEAADILHHIEVKSTAKNLADPFFMSHLQMDKAMEISETKRSRGPREVFVIFRVYDVEGKEPGLEIYCDPWSCIKSGRLSRETQEWRVSMA